jgi:hypothetical protein
MLCYSDFILEHKPFLYCRLNEPTGHNVYIDISGNRHHMYDETVDVVVQSATNRQALSVVGDPDAAGITPLGEKVSFNSSTVAIPDLSPQLIDFPTQYTNHQNIYGAGTKLHINRIWGEVIIKPVFQQRNPTDCAGGFEEIAAWGSIRLSVVTLVDCTGSPVFDGFKLVVWVARTEASSPPNPANQDFVAETLHEIIVQRTSTSTPFRYTGQDFVRFTVGIEQIDSHTLDYSIAEDGIVLASGTKSIAEYDFFYVDSDTSSFGYKAAAIMGKITASHYSYFLQSDFPDATWLADSQTALETSFTGTDYDDQVYLSRQTPGAAVVDNVPGSLLNLLDANLLIGFDQIAISGIDVTTSTTIEATVYSINGKNRTSHSFLVGDVIYIGGSTQSNLNGHWIVTDFSKDSITFVTDNTCTTQNFISTNETVIVKRSPIGGSGGRWVRTTVGSTAVYRSNHSSSNAKQLVISDNQEDYAEVEMSDTGGGNESETLYFRKNFKLVNSTNPDTSLWRMIGDGRRFYLFLAYRPESPSFVHAMIYGDIQDLGDSIWYTNLIAFKDGIAGNPGTNVAFQYPHWTILSTGHLQCELISKITSDARWARSTTGANTHLIGYGDAGRHIYPIPVPYLEYTP